MTDDTKQNYHMIDVNVYQEHIFHTKMLLKELNLDNYVFGESAGDLDEDEKAQIRRQLRREMAEIFYGRNIEPGKDIGSNLE